MTKKPDYANVFQTIKVDETTRKVFFSKLSRAENPFDWFDELEKRGYFDPTHMPVPSTNSEGDTIFEQWEVLGFLINCTLKNHILNYECYWDKIVRIIDESISFICSYRLDNYQTDFALVELIFNLPFSKIKCDWTTYIDYSMNTKGDSTLLSYKLTQGLEKILLSENQNAKTFLSKMTMLLLQPSQRNDDDSYSNRCSRMEGYALEQFFQKYAEQLSEVLKEDGVEICETLINEIINSDPTPFSVYLIPQMTITYSTNHYFELEQLLVSFLSLCLSKSPAVIVSERLEFYLRRDSQIFPRIAVFIMSIRFDDFRDLFFCLEENPLDNYFIKYEIFELLRQNASRLTEFEIQRMVEWIENQKFEYLKENELDEEESTNYKININKEWLFSLLETNNSKVLEMYNKSLETNPAPLTHPGYTFWMDYDEGEANGDNDLNLTTLKISEIVDKLNSFISDGKIQDRLNKIDISNSLREDVSTNPDKYLTDIMTLLELNPIFQYSLLIGLSGVAQNRDDFPWEEVLLYIAALLKRLDEQVISGNDASTLESVISAALNILELQLNSRNPSTESFQSVERIIALLLQSNRYFSFPSIDDEIIAMYNSVDFKLYSVWFMWFLQVHHLDLLSEAQKEEVKLEIAQYFENCRNLNAFHFSFGRFLPNFFSKEPAFVENVISKFDDWNDNRWIDFMGGYLFFGSNLYSGTYELLKRYKFYLKALNHHFTDNTVETRKIAHICLVFLEGQEPLSRADSLMKSILDSNNSRYFKEVINFIGRKQNLYSVEKSFDNFRELFLTLAHKVELCEDTETKVEMFGLMGGWIILFHHLDSETFECFKTIAKHLHLQHKTTTFLNHLITFSASQPDETSQLLKIALQSDSRNTFFDPEKMLTLIDALKVSLNSATLIPICNIFITKGYIQFSKKVQELNEFDNGTN